MSSYYDRPTCWVLVSRLETTDLGSVWIDSNCSAACLKHVFMSLSDQRFFSFWGINVSEITTVWAKHVYLHIEKPDYSYTCIHYKYKYPDF